MGLSNIRACADEMTLHSTVGVGTRLEMIFRLRPEQGAAAKAAIEQRVAEAAQELSSAMG